MDDEKAHAYFNRCQKKGRAVLYFHTSPDERGFSQPKLWMCKVGSAIFACDDIGPEPHTDVDYGFLERVTEDETVSDVRKRWKKERERMLAIRRDRRKRAAFVYHQRAARHAR